MIVLFVNHDITPNILTIDLRNASIPFSLDIFKIFCVNMKCLYLIRNSVFVVTEAIRLRPYLVFKKAQKNSSITAHHRQHRYSTCTEHYWALTNEPL